MGRLTDEYEKDKDGRSLEMGEGAINGEEE